MIQEIQERLEQFEFDDMIGLRNANRAEAIRFRDRLFDEVDQAKFTRLTRKLSSRQHILCVSLAKFDWDSYPSTGYDSVSDMLSAFAPVIGMTETLTSDFYEAVFQSIQGPAPVLRTFEGQRYGEAAANRFRAILEIVMVLLTIAIRDVGYTPLVSTIGVDDDFHFAFLLEESVGSQSITKRGKLVQSVKDTFRMVLGMIELRKQKLTGFYDMADLESTAKAKLRIKVTAKHQFLAKSTRVIRFLPNQKNRDVNRMALLLRTRFERAFVLPARIRGDRPIDSEVQDSLRAALSLLTAEQVAEAPVNIREVLRELRRNAFDYDSCSEQVKSTGWGEYLKLDVSTRYYQYSSFAIRRLILSSELVQTLNHLAQAGYFYAAVQDLKRKQKEIKQELRSGNLERYDQLIESEDKDFISNAINEIRESLKQMVQVIEDLDSVNMECYPLQYTFDRIINNTNESKILHLSGIAGSGKTVFLNALKATLPGLYPAEDEYLLENNIGRIPNVSLRRMFTCDEGDHGNRRCLVESFANLSRGGSTIYQLSQDKRKPYDTLYVLTTAREQLHNLNALIERHNTNCQGNRAGVGEDLRAQLDRRIAFITMSEESEYQESLAQCMALLRIWKPALGRLRRGVVLLREYGICDGHPWNYLWQANLVSALDEYVLSEFISYNLALVVETQRIGNGNDHDRAIRNQRMRTELFGEESEEEEQAMEEVAENTLNALGQQTDHFIDRTRFDNDANWRDEE